MRSERRERLIALFLTAQLVVAAALSAAVGFKLGPFFGFLAGLLFGAIAVLAILRQVRWFK